MESQFLLPALLLVCMHAKSTSEVGDELDILILHSSTEYLPNSQQDPEPQQDSGSQLAFHSALLAAELVNNRSDLLPGHHLHVILREVVDGLPYSTFAPIISSLTGDAATGHPVLGVISSTPSQSAGRTAALLGETELARLHLSLLPTPQHLPLSFSMLDTPDVLLRACIALIESRSLRQVNVLYEPQRDGRLPFDYSKLISSLNDINAVYSISKLDIAGGVQLKIHYQFQVLFVDIESIGPVLCAAYHLDVIFPMYQLVFVIGSLDCCPLMSHGKLHSCTADEVALAARGALILQYKVQPFNSSLPSESGLTYLQFESLLASWAGPTKCLSPEIPLLFDAVWALALALNSSLLPAGQQQNTTLSADQHGDFGAPSLGEQLRELSFLGVTGGVDFSAHTGHSSRDVGIYQSSQELSLSLVGSFSTQNSSLQLFSNLQHASSDFMFTCPFFIITPPRIISVFSFVACFLLTLFLLTTHILTLWFRKQPSVKADSYKLTQLMYVGSYVLILAAVSNTCLEGFPDSLPQRTICDLWRMLNSAASLGMTFIFGSLSVRTWRLYRILIHFRKPGRFLSDAILLGGVLACFCLDLVVIVFWSVLDPFIPLCRVLDEERSQGTIQCTQVNYFVYLLFLMIFNLLLMTLCATFALLTIRKYSIDFHLRNTVCGAFWVMGVVVIGLPIYFLLLLVNDSEVSITYRLIFLNLLVLGGVVMVCVFILVPPLIPVLKEKVLTRVDTYVCTWKAKQIVDLKS